MLMKLTLDAHVVAGRCIEYYKVEHYLLFMFSHPKKLFWILGVFVSLSAMRQGMYMCIYVFVYVYVYVYVCVCGRLWEKE